MKETAESVTHEYPATKLHDVTFQKTNFHSHHLGNMKSHSIVSTEPAPVLFLQPILKFRQLRLSFSRTLRKISYSLLFLVPCICSVVLSVANCPRLSPIYDALPPHRHYLSAIFIFHFYLLNPHTHNKIKVQSMTVLLKM